MEARHLSAERRREILSLVMRDPKSVVSAGGSALNTAMALQWSLGDYAEDVKACGCLGAIGEDEAGKILENSLQRTNVTALFQKVKVIRCPNRPMRNFSTRVWRSMHCRSKRGLQALEFEICHRLEIKSE
mmetsp:Transcript_8310/g.11783  ORF Transcript_8310/g.11783 Transcript_8310/m.11783 type:complete len:130 (-) Transcript_8310:896-1285(-)